MARNVPYTQLGKTSALSPDHNTVGACMQKRWNVLIIPNTSEQGQNFTVSASTIKLAAAGLFIVLTTVLVLCGATAHSWKSKHAAEVNNLEQKLETRDAECATVREEFASLLVLEDKLRTIAGLQPRQTPVNQVVGAGGQGGRGMDDQDSYEDEMVDPVVAAREAFKSTDALVQAMASARDSFSEILEAFENEQERLSSIPSINPVYSPDAWISSSFGYRKDPINGQRRFHDGMDIVAPNKTPIIAPAEGVVAFAGWRDGLGRAVEIRHKYGYTTVFGHSYKLLVKKGAHVERGDTIALLGNSGRSTGPHVHYEIRHNGKPINPYRYVLE
jgi:murein DD-endopeptidase MepM/ murein hydrolase activator NlpD